MQFHLNPKSASSSWGDMNKFEHEHPFIRERAPKIDPATVVWTSEESTWCIYRNTDEGLHKGVGVSLRHLHHHKVSSHEGAQCPVNLPLPTCPWIAQAPFQLGVGWHRGNMDWLDFQVKVWWPPTLFVLGSVSSSVTFSMSSPIAVLFMFTWLTTGPMLSVLRDGSEVDDHAIPRWKKPATAI